MSDYKGSRAQMSAFVEQHLAVLCQELAEWQDTALLRDGKMRELARLCTFDTDQIRQAERMVEYAAIRAIAAR